MTPSGERYWRMNYRHYRKHNTLPFGVWLDMGLAEARAERDVAAELRIALIAPSPHIAPQLTAAELLRAIEGF